jgi:hypothetical protein
VNDGDSRSVENRAPQLRPVNTEIGPLGLVWRRWNPQGVCYFDGDVVLDHEDVVEGSVVGFGPDDVAVVGADQARIDS